MKLRCTQDSIRLRLRKSDIHTLRQERSVCESLYLGNQLTFSFCLSLQEGKKEIVIEFSDNKLNVQLPLARALHWMDTQEVGIEEELHWESKERKLHLLIEKDFPCLDREHEDKSDTFWELTGEKPENC